MSAVCCSTLSSMGLAGQLPLDPTIWGALPALSVLDLHNNTMNGYLPPQVTRPGLRLEQGCAPFVASVRCMSLHTLIACLVIL